MDKKQFKEFCTNEFKVRGFKKRNTMFYLAGNELLCGIKLQKSDYSNSYYVNFYFFLGNFNETDDYPINFDLDVQGRVIVMSKAQTVKGKQILTSTIEYEEYTEEELRPYFDKEFEERILPPVYQGKKYILDNLGKLYSLTLHKEEVMRKLQS